MQDAKQMSVILLCYRVFDYLFDTIDSVLMQDYPNIELVVSDDGSQHFPAEEISTYIESNRRENLRSLVVRHEAKNVGTVRHFNNAIAASHGDFLCVLAGDDRLYDAQVLTHYVKGFERAPEGCLVEMAQIAMCDSTLKHLQAYYVEPEVQRALEASDSQALFDRLTIIACLPTVSTVFRREFVARYGKFDESYTLVEDYPMHLRLARERWCIHYENFIASAHRDGGISHGNRQGVSHSYILYSQDIKRTYEAEIFPHLDSISPQLQTFVQIKCKKEIANYDSVISQDLKGLRGKWLRFFQHPFMFMISYFLEFYRKTGNYFNKSRGFLFVFGVLLLFLAPVIAEVLCQASQNVGLNWMSEQHTWLRLLNITGIVWLIVAAIAYFMRLIAELVHAIWNFPNIER